MLPVESAFKIYVGLDGNPLDNGYIYFGSINQNPITSPITVYWDAAGTQPAVQPLRTLNGYIVRNGTPANVFVNGNYSQLVRNSSQVQVYYEPDSSNYSVSSQVFNFIASLAAPTGATLVGYLTGTVSSALDYLYGVVNLARTRLTADRTYYVRTDGNDSNNGLTNSAGGAFLTLQKAVNVISETLDLNGHNVTVQAIDGTYTAGVQVLAPWVGKGTVYMTGNIANPSLCIVSISGLSCFYAENGASLTVSGFKVVNSSGEGVYAQTGAKITVGPMEYGACANSHVTVGGGGFINLTANYTVTGGGTSHLHAGSIGAITSSVINATLIGTPNFSSYFAGAAEGTITCKDITFSGVATGPTHLAHKNGVIDTHPAFASLPGSIAGRQATGGSYIGSQTTPFRIAPNLEANNSVRMQSYNVTTSTFTDRFIVESQPSGAGGGHAWAYVDGDDSFMSGRTHIGCPSIVLLANANDGTTFTPGTAAFLSQTSQAAANFRRNGTDGALMNFYKGGASAPQVGSITVTGSATAFNTSSDPRLKYDIKPLTDSGAFIDALEPCSYRWKADGSSGSGFLADKLKKVSPSSVTGEAGAVDDNGDPIYQSVFYGSPEIIANYGAELKSLRKRLAEVESKINQP